jgi:anaerobic glycerol-3-phosphate dehydrogenase
VGETIIGWLLLLLQRANAQTATPAAAPASPNLSPWITFVGQFGLPLAAVVIVVYRLWPRFEKFLDAATIRAEKLETQRDEQNLKFADVLQKYSENSKQVADQMSAQVTATRALADQVAMVSRTMAELALEVRVGKHSSARRGRAS